MTSDPTPQVLPLERSRYVQWTPDGWQGADHPDGPWRPIPAPQTQPPFPVVAEPPPTVRYEFEVTDEHGQAVASGDADTMELAEREGRHYLGQYSQDGPCTLELRRVEVLKVSSPEPQPVPAPAAADPPLWQVMDRAYNEVGLGCQGYALEILAVRDRVVPEEPPPVAPTDSPAWLHWQQRQAIRALLTTEAARAERGE